MSDIERASNREEKSAKRPDLLELSLPRWRTREVQAPNRQHRA